MSGTQQWLRQISLIVADAQGNGIELSQLHVTFEVQSQTTSSPATLSARIYNVAPNTANLLQSMPMVPAGSTVPTTPAGGQAPASSNGKVILRAGYEGNFGIVFQGDLMQVSQGRESPADTFVEVFAADGDWGHSWALINRTLASGWTPDDANDALKQAYSPYGVEVQNLPDGVPKQSAPRGKVMFGMARDHIDPIKRSLLVDGFYAAGQLRWLPQSAYNPGEAVVVNASTGMIGLPTQTSFGVAVRMLLNPSVGPGSSLQINNASIQRLQYSAAVGGATENQFLKTNLSKQADGLYKVVAVNQTGDTRGTNWYTDAVCMAVDPQGQVIKPVQYAGYYGFPS